MWQFKKYISANKKPLLIALAIMALSFILYFQSDETSFLLENKSLKRGDYQGKADSANLNVKVGDLSFENVEVKINSQKYTDEMLNTLFLESHDLIKDRLAIDTGEGFVSKDLSFDSTLPDSPLSFEWIPLDKDIIDEEGKIKTPYETITSVKVIASYEDWSDYCIFEFKICPGEEIKQRFVREQVEELIKEADLDSIEEDVLWLPDCIDGISIEYEEKGGRNITILLVGISLSLLTLLAAVFDRKKEMDKRKEEMLEEYPVVIQKLVMYISGGMTVRNAWKRICDSSQADKKRNLIYDQMIKIQNEIDTGISEGLAYEHFGEMVNDNLVVRFTTLLSQNIKKGSTSLSDLLKEESIRAFETRKNRAKKKGEEAGTKLLLPMTLLLLVVTVIIMVPAFWNL